MMGWDGGGGGGTRVICWIPNQSLMSHRRQSLMTLVAEYPLHPCPFLTLLPPTLSGATIGSLSPCRSG